MGLFDNFPYTNFHELNLDWLLETTKKALDQYAEMKLWQKDVDDRIADIQEYVDNYFATLDVDQAVRDRLDQLVADGTITGIVRQVVTQYINDSQVWGFTPLLYYAMDNGSYTASPTSSWQQAITTDGVYTYQFFANASTPGSVVAHKYRNSDKALILAATIANGYHANGADYYNGHIYLATLDDDTILEVDPETLIVRATHHFTGYGFRAVSVDNDGTVYGAAGNTWYVLNLDNDTVGASYALSGATVGTWQSGIIREGYAYEACSDPRCVIKFDLLSGSPVHAYPIDRYVDIYQVGEVESIAEDRNGHFYVGSTAGYPFARYTFACVLKVNAHGEPTHSVYSGYNTLSYGAIYVGPYSSSGLTTGTQDDPFPCLAMALMAFNSPTLQSLRTTTINLLADCNEAFYTRNGRITLNGNDHVIGSVYGLNSDLEIQNVEIAHRASENQPNARSVQLSNCRTFLHNIEVTQSLAGSSASIQLSGGSSQLYAITLSDGINIISAYRHLFKADPTSSQYITES